VTLSINEPLAQGKGQEPLKYSYVPYRPNNDSWHYDLLFEGQNCALWTGKYKGGNSGIYLWMRKYSNKPGDDLDQHRFALKPFACWLRSCTKLVISWWVTSTTLSSVLWHMASEYVNQLTVHIPCTAGKPLLEKYIAHIHSGAACVWRIHFLKQIMTGCITNFHKYLYLKSLFGVMWWTLICDIAVEAHMLLHTNKMVYAKGLGCTSVDCV
jgi:hypothetical protein